MNIPSIGKDFLNRCQSVFKSCKNDIQDKIQDIFKHTFGTAIDVPQKTHQSLLNRCQIIEEENCIHNCLQSIYEFFNPAKTRMRKEASRIYKIELQYYQDIYQFSDSKNLKDLLNFYINHPNKDKDIETIIHLLKYIPTYTMQIAKMLIFAGIHQIPKDSDLFELSKTEPLLAFLKYYKIDTAFFANMVTNLINQKEDPLYVEELPTHLGTMPINVGEIQLNRNEDKETLKGLAASDAFTNIQKYINHGQNISPPPEITLPPFSI